MQKIVAIVQARTGSTRLPGKVLRPLLGKPMLAHLLERVRRSKLLDEIVVATTDTPSDDAVATLAKENGFVVFRGSEHDVLDRYYKAAKEAGATIVVRLTGDCPLHDPAVIDKVVAHFLKSSSEYTITPANYPEGVDTEVFSFEALERAWRDAALPSEREHVTPYIRNHPELFRIDGAWRSGEDEHASMHWSVDTQADFDFVARVYEQLYPENPGFSKDDVLGLLAAHPEFLEINKGGTGYEGLEKSVREDALPGKTL